MSKKEILWNSFFLRKIKRKSLAHFKKHELNALVLLCIERPAQLSAFSNVSFFGLEESMNHPVYTHYIISKKKGGKREIYAPDKDLKKIQKQLNYFLQAYYLCIKPKEVHGFVIHPHYLGIHCNIVANANEHVGKKFVLNIDLKDFFPSISAKQVKEIFSSRFFNFNDQIATALTLLTTYEGKLPVGAPTSPVLSNFVCHQLDSDLINFSSNHSLSFTRYADDLTFSSNNFISNDNILDIINLIEKNNFRINEKKLRLQTSNRKQTVTGITVNEKINVDRKLLKKIRAMLHDLIANGIESATRKHFNIKGEVASKLKSTFINRLNGYINFVGQVRGKEDEIYKRMKEQLKAVEVLKVI